MVRSVLLVMMIAPSDQYSLRGVMHSQYQNALQSAFTTDDVATTIGTVIEMIDSDETDHGNRWRPNIQTIPAVQSEASRSKPNNAPLSIAGPLESRALALVSEKAAPATTVELQPLRCIRKRTRSMTQSPRFGGKPCPPLVQLQLVECTKETNLLPPTVIDHAVGLLGPPVSATKMEDTETGTTDNTTTPKKTGAVEGRTNSANSEVGVAEHANEHNATESTHSTLVNSDLTSETQGAPFSSMYIASERR